MGQTSRSRSCPHAGISPGGVLPQSKHAPASEPWQGGILQNLLRKSSLREKSNVLHSFVPEVPRRRANIPMSTRSDPLLARPGVDIPCAGGAGNDRNWCLSPPPAPDSCPPGPPPPHYRGLGLETLAEQVVGTTWTCVPTPLPVVHTGSDAPRPKTTAGGAQHSPHKQPGPGRALTCARGPHSSKWGPAAQTCSGRLSAGRGGHPEWRARFFFTRTVILGCFGQRMYCPLAG